MRTKVIELKETNSLNIISIYTSLSDVKNRACSLLVKLINEHIVEEKFKDEELTNDQKINIVSILSKQYTVFVDKMTNNTHRLNPTSNDVGYVYRFTYKPKLNKIVLRQRMLPFQGAHKIVPEKYSESHCDFCKKAVSPDELEEVCLYGTDDLYKLNACEECENIYSDSYSPEDVETK